MKKEILWSCLLAIGVLALCAPSPAQGNPSPKSTIRRAVSFGISLPLRELVKLPQPVGHGIREDEPYSQGIPANDFGRAVDPVEQSAAGATANYSLGLNVPGIGNGFPGFFVPVDPPDTNIAVGDTQIVEWVNVDYAVFDKATGLPLTLAVPGNTLWSGNPDCGSANDGDPTVQWDAVAHRWLMNQNTYYLNPNYACIAVSTSPDAMGSYYLYEFSLGNEFAHYSHWGVWPTGYFVTMLVPDSNWHSEVCAYNRGKMLVGDSSTEQICIQLPNDGDNSNLLPADVDSPTPPPAGEDEFFIGGVNAVDNSHLSLYSMHINNQNDWSQGATFTGEGNSQLIAVAPYTSACAYPVACVPQLDTNFYYSLQAQGGLVMYRFVYWEDKPSIAVSPATPGQLPAQHWFTNQTVLASGGNGAVRWYEFTAPIKKVPVTSLTVFQQGTFAPDSNWRWMASMARDKVGDILVGYSVSSARMYPGIAIAGRRGNDPLGTLENEVTVVNGTGSQLDLTSRWGDYSSMRIDEDGCTFWYTQEYYKVTTDTDWSTRIVSAKFPNCQ